jgi:hypothetical protein
MKPAILTRMGASKPDLEKVCLVLAIGTVSTFTFGLGSFRILRGLIPLPIIVGSELGAPFIEGKRLTKDSDAVVIVHKRQVA